MYESQTYDEILARSLARVTTDVDKREGSLIFSAIAPASAEMAQIYILLDGLINDGFADTATRDYLVRRCKERGIIPYEATKAVLKGEFNMVVPIGSRFSLSDLNYKAISYIGLSGGVYSYQLECETAGTEGNRFFGELTQITFISSTLSGNITELLIPAEDEEDTEELRARYFSSFNSSPFGGNKQDYITKTNGLAGVGGTKVTPVWNGGGTVKITIINSDFDKASSTLVANVQTALDPIGSQGQGVGIAPIGHTVTVDTVTEVAVNISVRLTFLSGYTWASISASAINAIKDYLLELREAWAGEQALAVRVVQVENRLLNLDGVLDVANTTINGVAGNLVLTAYQIPVYGGVVNV